MIDAPGTYEVTAPLSRPTVITLSCLEIDAPKVRLNLDGNSITSGVSASANVQPDCKPNIGIVIGSLPVIGIHLTRHADNAVIVGGGAMISGFGDSGIEIESSGAIISELKADANIVGIELNKAHGVQLTNIEASNNLGNGLSLIRSPDNQISAFTGNNNGGAGISIFGPSDANRVTAFQANSNKCGVDIAPSSCNGSTGSRSGCIPRGGRGNTLTGGTASGNAVYGISLEEPTSSAIVDNTATMNGTFDLMDEAANCAHNLWFGNTFTTASPASCIH